MAILKKLKSGAEALLRGHRTVTNKRRARKADKILKDLKKTKSISSRSINALKRDKQRARTRARRFVKKRNKM